MPDTGASLPSCFCSGPQCPDCEMNQMTLPFKGSAGPGHLQAHSGHYYSQLQCRRAAGSHVPRGITALAGVERRWGHGRTGWQSGPYPLVGSRASDRGLSRSLHTRTCRNCPSSRATSILLVPVSAQ